jgi:hypothetical protein
MPIGFIFISLILLFLIMYKDVVLFNEKKAFFIFLLFFLLFGYFVKPIEINGLFNVNVFFIIALGVIAMLNFLKLNLKNKIIAVLCSGLIFVCYYILTSMNSENFSFFNYLPATVIITIFSLFFVKNAYLGSSIITFSFLLIEIFNYPLSNANLGYLTMCSITSINFFILSLVIYSVFNYILYLFYKIKFKNLKVANEKK